MAAGRQSLAGIEKTRRKTSRMTKMEKRRKSSMSNNPNEEQIEPKIVSKRKTMKRKTVNFEFR